MISLGLTSRTKPSPRGDGEPRWSLNAVQESYRKQFLEKLSDGRYYLEDVPTCVCGSENSQPVMTGDRFGLPVGMVVCTECGLLRTTPRLAAECLPKFYEDDYHGLHMGTPEPPPGQALFKSGQGSRIYEFIGPRVTGPSLNVIEVGCGTGTVLREFEVAARADGRTVSSTGCEYSDAYVAEGRRLGTNVLHGGIDALEGTPVPDVIIMSHVLEHFADVRSELAKLRGLAGPGTLFYIEVPGVFAIHRNKTYDYELGKYFTLAHTYHFTLATLRKCLADAGLEVLNGDERVACIARAAAIDGNAIPGAYAEMVSYLDQLSASSWHRLRKAALHTRRTSRRLAARLVRTVAREAGVRTIRRLRSGRETAGTGKT